MVVDAEVFYWTPDGMQRRPRMGSPPVRYIRASDAERLLEEAHRRGAEQVRTESNLQRLMDAAKALP